MSRRNHSIYAVCLPTGYPLWVYPGTQSGLKRAADKMLSAAESRRDIGMPWELEVRRFRLEQIESFAEAGGAPAGPETAK